MIRLLFFTAFLSFSIIHSDAQSIFPPGGYAAIDELRNRQPSIHLEFKPVFRNKEEVMLIGGNDYFMRCTGEGIDQETIIKEVFAVSIGPTLFINTLVHKLATGYANALCEGRYIAFHSGFKDKRKKRALSAAIDLDSTGLEHSIPASTRALFAKAEPAKRYLLAMDIQTGIVCLCDRNFLIGILKPFPGLEYQYALEPEQSSEQILINYVQMVNNAIE